MSSKAPIPQAPLTTGASSEGMTSSNVIIQRYFVDLKNKNEQIRMKGGNQLRNFVASQARELSVESFSKVMNEVYKTIGRHVNLNPKEDKLAAVQAIDCLLELDYDENENANKISKFGSYLRIALVASDAAVLISASKALGRLVRIGGTLSAELADSQLKRALEWLSPDRMERIEARRHAAALVLKELATAAPTMFNVHVGAFVDLIWEALREPNPVIRDSAVEAVRACLDVIAERQNSLRTQWYNMLWTEALKCTRQSKESLPVLQAGLQVVGELLVNTGDFMDSHFRDACDLLLTFRDHKDKNVRKIVATYAAKAAQFEPDTFTKQYLNTSLSMLINYLKTEKPDKTEHAERGRYYLSIGEIAIAVKLSIKPYMESILSVIKMGISSKKKPEFFSEALRCLSLLAIAVGGALRPYMNDIIPDLFNGGFSTELTECVQTLRVHVPAVATDAQEMLLNHIALSLGHKPYSEPIVSKSQATPQKRGHQSTPSIGKVQSVEFSSASSIEEDLNTSVALTLSILRGFDFTTNTNIKSFDAYLEQFVRATIMGYLDNSSVIVRREAARTIAILVGKLFSYDTKMALQNEVVERLLVVATADNDSSVRYEALTSLNKPEFDYLLSQPENLRTLFLGLNDEEFDVRQLAIAVIGRLTTHNPAYVMPSLRKTLIQLLGDLQFNSDSHKKEEAARLLAHLLKATDTLMSPLVDTIIEVLLPRLTKEASFVASCVLAAIGEVSMAAGSQLLPHTQTILPFILSTLQEHSQTSAAKREVAIRALGQLASNSGYVIQPFFDFPELFDLILNELKTENSPSVRREVIKSLGALGALDPFKYRSELQVLLKGNSLELATGKTVKDISMEKDTRFKVVATSSTEAYYPTVAVSSLVRMLRDPSLNMHYKKIIESLLPILKSISWNPRLKLKPFLRLIMPTLLSVMRNTADPTFRQWLFQELSVFAEIAGHNIRNYLPQIFRIVNDQWDVHLKDAISFIKSIANSKSQKLRSEFKVYLPDLIPPMLKVLANHSIETHDQTRAVLDAFESFGRSLADYLHLVVPAMTAVIDTDTVDMETHKAALITLGKLAEHLDFSDFATRIIHPIVNILKFPIPDAKKEANQYQLLMDLRKEALKTLCALVFQLEVDYAGFIPIVHSALVNQNVGDSHDYEVLVGKLLRNQPLRDDVQDKTNARNSQRLEMSPGTEKRSESLAASVIKLKVSEKSLQEAWSATSRKTKEDWMEWIRVFSVRVLQNSPSPSLRSTQTLASDYYPLVRELFNAAFISCWTELDDYFKSDLKRNLEVALTATTPPEILQTLLNLLEFMEHEEQPIPIEKALLALLAEQNHAYAKALYYREEDFLSAPKDMVESLISLNNQLGQSAAAVGVLKHAQRRHNIEMKDSWYEKLHQWEQALNVYEKQIGTNKKEVVLGNLRCLHALGEWEKLQDFSKASLANPPSDADKPSIARFGAAAALNTQHWEAMSTFVEFLDRERTFEGNFYRAVLSISKNDFPEALAFIGRARDLIDVDLSSLIGESYDRAYDAVIRVQQLTELEEVIKYKETKDNPNRLTLIKQIWNQRLLGTQRSVDTWQKILPIRGLVVPPTSDSEMWIKFASLCRRSNLMTLASKTLLKLLNVNQPQILAVGRQSVNPQSLLQSIQLNQLHQLQQQQTQQQQPLLLPVPTLAETANFLNKSPNRKAAYAYVKHIYAQNKSQGFDLMLQFAPSIATTDSSLKARAYEKLGMWQFALEPLDDEVIPRILSSLKAATDYDPNWYRAWHSWALVNFEVITHYETNYISPERIDQHLVPAIRGFFEAISLSTTGSLQDTLRLLTLWFKYGHQRDVEKALATGFSKVRIDTWLQVIPQIIARIAAPAPSVRKLIHELLISVAKEHPQALVFPLTLSLQSHSPDRETAAQRVLQSVNKQHSRLVDEALLVSKELVRAAISWNEIWHEALEEASRLHFAEHKPQEAMNMLEPMHHMLEKGAETLAEEAFMRNCGRDLMGAAEWLARSKQSGQLSDFHQAWDLYYGVFKKTKQSIANLESIQLEYVAPKLVRSRDLQLAVPGTYKAGKPVIHLSSFNPNLTILSSKQRPRKLVLNGSDGSEYVFLLKGHEDLRQDERVMQLFGLVNTLLASEFETSRDGLSIQRYSVVPLAPNSGLLGWVPHTDTLNALIRGYRDARKIPTTNEHRALLQMAPDFANLSSLNKVEAFMVALESTDGMDLKKISWLQSENAESWLDRRTVFTRSLAVMSMVGYILGLGDRHCSNIMIDRKTGKAVHIDFGDCFEVAMVREKFPERVPFRLTRMLINAMGVSGVEGNFRTTAENVMRVLRENKESLMAVLEAFVYDPLINWRLLFDETSKQIGKENVVGEDDATFLEGSSVRTKVITAADEADTELPEVLNTKAVAITKRINNKLTGRDFSPKTTLDVTQQVDLLIKQATDVANLSQCYLGWSPFW